MHAFLRAHATRSNRLIDKTKPPTPCTRHLLSSKQRPCTAHSAAAAAQAVRGNPRWHTQPRLFPRQPWASSFLLSFSSLLLFRHAKDFMPTFSFLVVKNLKFRPDGVGTWKFSLSTGLSEGCLGTKSYPTKVAVPGTEGDGSIEFSTENDSLNSPPKRTLRNSVSRDWITSRLSRY